MNNTKGTILVYVMVTMLLIMTLGTAAIKMSELGYHAYGSDRRYQMVVQAAEQAINAAVDSVITNNACPSGTTSGSISYGGAMSVAYSYRSITTGNYCFITGTGTFGGASVAKTVVVPATAGTTAIGALTLRNGGTVGVGGSASIANFDTVCPTPGVLYGGSMSIPTTGNQSGLLVDTIPDPPPNNPNGIYGANAVQNINGTRSYWNSNTSSIVSANSTVMNNLIPALFDTSCTNLTNATCWDALLSSFSGDFNGYTVNMSNLSVTNIPSATAPSPSCNCTGNVTLTSTSTNCTGVSNFALCGGNIRLTGTGNQTLQGIPAGITNVIANRGNITISSVSSSNASFSGVSIYTTGTTKNITINDPDVILTGSTIKATGQVTVTNVNSIVNSTVLAAGNMTLNGNIDNSLVAATGNNGQITIASGNINNSMITRQGAYDNSGDAIYVDGGNITNSTLISKDEIHLNSGAGTITDSHLMTDCMPIEKGGGNFSGGMLYTTGNMWFQGTGGGNQQFGTSANPTLFLSGKNLNIQHTNGDIEMNGLIFNNGWSTYANQTGAGDINYTGNGNFQINGAMVGNSGTSTNTLGSSGNAGISFNRTILSLLAARYGSKIKDPNTGVCVQTGGSRSSYVNFNKATAY